MTQSSQSTTLASWNHKGRMGLSDEYRTRTSSRPVLANHSGKLWCLWVSSPSSRLTWSIYENHGEWGEPMSSQTESSNLNYGVSASDLDGTLHVALFNGAAGQVVHYQYNDTEKVWGNRTVIPTSGAIASDAAPALCAFEGKLYCVIKASGRGKAGTLSWCAWNSQSGWTTPKAVGESTWGCPSLYVMNKTLQLVFSESNEKDRVIDCSQFDPTKGSWTRIQKTPDKSIYGVTANSDYGTAYMAFQSDNGKSEVLVSFNNGTSWQKHDGDGIGQKSSNTPAIGVFNSKLICVYDSTDGMRNLQWSESSIHTDPANWMGSAKLSAGIYVSQLSIPGTHDSAAWYPSIPYVQTQGLNILDQLNAGIRFFDLRCGLVSNQPYMYHGVIPLGQWLNDIIITMRNWLSDHPMEGILISIKEDDAPPILSDMHFATAIRENVVQRFPTQLWRTEGNIPRLQDIRGKIQIFRRYEAPQEPDKIGIDMNPKLWEHNSAHFTIKLGGMSLVRIQDHFEIDSSDVVAVKRGDISRLMDEAIKDSNSQNLYLNFSSVTGKGSWTTPLGFAVELNSYLRQTISTHKSATHLGIVVMDFPDVEPTLIQAMVDTNFIGK